MLTLRPSKLGPPVYAHLADYEMMDDGQASRLLRRFGPLINRWQSQFRSTLDDDAAVEEQHRRSQHVKRTCALRALKSAFACSSVGAAGSAGYHS
jgi:hypothetical protein